MKILIKTTFQTNNFFLIKRGPKGFFIMAITGDIVVVVVVVTGAGVVVVVVVVVVVTQG